LKRFAELHNSGVLSDEEFAEAKAKLFGATNTSTLCPGIGHPKHPDWAASTGQVELLVERPGSPRENGSTAS
jgi:hypothetical protein